jgi:hypothetical protein
VLPSVLKIMAPVFLAVGAIHLLLGVGAEVLLGAALTEATVSDPVLDSQNRFYGVSFSVYGVLLYIAATDLARYRPVVTALLWMLFAGGMARVVSIIVVGLPSALVLLLMAVEILVPLLLIFWLSRHLPTTTSRPRG